MDLSHPEVLVALRRARDLTDRDFAQPLLLPGRVRERRLLQLALPRPRGHVTDRVPECFCGRAAHPGLLRDATMDGFRWLTVGPKDQPDVNILLARPQPPMFTEDDAQALLRLVAKGVIGAGVMETDDIRPDYEELEGKGVTFLQEPAERPYGIEALFRDDSGNWFSLNQHKRSGG